MTLDECIKAVGAMTQDRHYVMDELSEGSDAVSPDQYRRDQAENEFMTTQPRFVEWLHDLSATPELDEYLYASAAYVMCKADATYTRAANALDRLMELYIADRMGDPYWRA